MWSIVIATWQRAELLRSTLDSLRNQGADYEVVVVCDGEDAATRSLSGNYAAEFPLRWLFHEQNRGQAAARNTGAQAARGERLLFLDDDMVASPSLLAAHAGAHWTPSGPSPCVAFGRTIEERIAPIASRTDRFLQEGWETILARCFPASGEPNTTSVGTEAEQSVVFGVNYSITRDAFIASGGFDSALCSDEDVELGLRLYRRGAQFRYAPEAVVTHRNTRRAIDYLPQCWSQSAAQDLHRARCGQRSIQNRQLSYLRHGDRLQRTMARSAWRDPELHLRVARACECATDFTGAWPFFALWTRFRKTGEYWGAMRATGATEATLHQLAGPVKRILAFHSISDAVTDAERNFYTSPAKFRRYISWLKTAGYKFHDPRESLDSAGDRSVVVTFDDAYDDIYTEVFQLTVQLGLKPLVFVVGAQIGGSNVWDQRQGYRSRALLTAAQIRELQKHGFVFGAHSMTHASLPSLADADLVREVRDSKARLEDLLGERVTWFAYPFGHVDRRVRAAVAEAGFTAAVTTHPGLSWWDDPLALKRIEIYDRDTLLDFVLKVQTGRDVRRGLLRRVKRLLSGTSA